ncbi:transmembrane protein 154 isoform X4 [Poeciliopsis prolifica]|uniref:transmembrane protein 154 isoform X4 n=1 Tax=Poeciliopsis prolifica TaxID=188132 RepID=UPI00241427E3|nr:transmembrane protein 154 isoform X4 [Poeciliopsis prolifica]
MAAPRLKTPALILLLLSALTGTAFCQHKTSNETRKYNSPTSNNVSTTTPPASPGTNDRSTNTTQGEGTENGEIVDLPILIGAVVASVIIGGIIIIGVVVWRRRSKKAWNQELTKEDPHLDGPSSEKVPMPMFEEDVPSVLELEMDELDQWMKKDC